MITKEKIYEILEDVKDPEIPTISIVDLGIVTEVKINDNNSVSITLTPTFTGCPALEIIEKLVEEKVKEFGVKEVDVKTTFDVQWNTNMITEKGKLMLEKHGLTSPQKHNGFIQIEMLRNVKCPFCGSNNTTLRSTFGSALCRAIHYCNNCLQSFEQFKPVA